MDVVNTGFVKEFRFGLERWQGRREGNRVLY